MSVCSYSPLKSVSTTEIDRRFRELYKNVCFLLSQGGGGGTTIYSGDGALSGNRIVDLAGNSLTFENGSIICELQGQSEIGITGEDSKLSIYVAIDEEDAASIYDTFTSDAISDPENPRCIRQIAASMTNGEDYGLQIDTLGIFVAYDNRTIPTGILYSDDFSATFIERSLVDKGYVDAAIATAIANL